MSAAEHQSSNSSKPSKQSLKKPPRRPSLVQPPSRSPDPATDAAPASAKPSRPAVQVSTAVSANGSADLSTETMMTSPVEATPQPVPALHPISPPSEPMQYRAIGLVRGTYIPSEEQLNRGCLVTEEGTVIDSVLLGRVTSLVKKHIGLDVPHLWVVYPRTRQPEEDDNRDTPENNSSAADLHLQIVGVWEPETLGMPGENPGAATSPVPEPAAATDSTESVDDSESVEPNQVSDAPEPIEPELTGTAAAAPESAMPAEATHQAELPDGAEPLDAATDTDLVEPAIPSEPSPASAEEPAAAIASNDLPSTNYFSIRGEILQCDDDAQQIQVKILQKAKRADKGQKAFRLHVAGQISGKTVGYFWELDVERQGKELVLIDGHAIGIVPPKKNKRKKKGPGGFKGKRPVGPGNRPRTNAPQPKTKPRIRPSAPVKSNPL